MTIKLQLPWRKVDRAPAAPTPAPAAEASAEALQAAAHELVAQFLVTASDAESRAVEQAARYGELVLQVRISPPQGITLTAHPGDAVSINLN